MPRFDVPILRLANVEPAGGDRLRFVGDGLRDLAQHCEDFEAALLLYEEIGAEDEEIYRLGAERRFPGSKPYERNLLIDRWAEIAMREGAAILHRYAEDLGALTENIRACPALLGRLSWPALRKCTKRFHATFPDAALIRHATSHSRGYISGTPERHLENIGAHRVVGVIAGPAFETVMKGKRVGYRLSRESADALESITYDYLETFRDMDVLKRMVLHRRACS